MSWDDAGCEGGDNEEAALRERLASLSRGDPAYAAQLNDLAVLLLGKGESAEAQTLLDDLKALRLPQLEAEQQAAPAPANGSRQAAPAAAPLSCSGAAASSAEAAGTAADAVEPPLQRPRGGRSGGMGGGVAMFVRALGGRGNTAAPRSRPASARTASTSAPADEPAASGSPAPRAAPGAAASASTSASKPEAAARPRTEASSAPESRTASQAPSASASPARHAASAALAGMRLTPAATPSAGGAARSTPSRSAASASSTLKTRSPADAPDAAPAPTEAEDAAGRSAPAVETAPAPSTPLPPQPPASSTPEAAAPDRGARAGGPPPAPGSRPQGGAHAPSARASPMSTIASVATHARRNSAGYASGGAAGTSGRDSEGSDSDNDGGVSRAVRVAVGNCTHVLEAYGLTTAVHTSHLEDFVVAISPQDGRPLPLVKWVDDHHALLVCPNGATANLLLQEDQDLYKLRPFAEASSASKAVSVAELLPPRERPKTTAAVAKKMLSHALGMNELRDRQGERDLAAQRKAAKEARRERAAKLAAAWDDD